MIEKYIGDLEMHCGNCPYDVYSVCEEKTPYKRTDTGPICTWEKFGKVDINTKYDELKKIYRKR